MNRIAVSIVAATTGGSPVWPRASPSSSTLDPSLVRVLWVLSIFFGGLGIFLYIAMAIIVPLEPDGGHRRPRRPASAADAGDRRAGGRRAGGRRLPPAHRHATPPARALVRCSSGSS